MQHPDFYPTRANILRAIQWLMMDLRFGDALFFHFSGHGSQLRDPTGARTACMLSHAHAFRTACTGGAPCGAPGAGPGWSAGEGTMRGRAALGMVLSRLRRCW